MLGAVIKTALVVGSGIGGSIVTSNAVKAVTPVTSSKLVKGLSWLGGFALAGVMGSIAAKGMSHDIKEVESWFAQDPPDTKK
jgi:hypothetical protein